MGLINNKYCTINDCSNIWKVKQKKIILEKNKCVYDCIEDEDYPFTFKNKCYNKCPDGTYLSNEEEKICSIKCTEELPYEKNDECFEECTISEFLSKICTIKNKTVQAKENMINKISNEIEDGSINSMLTNVYDGEKEDLIVKDIEEIYQITTSYNQNNNVYNNRETTIVLGECEDILKEENFIVGSLIIFKMDYYLEEFLIPIVEYEIFNPLTKEKLNLTKCSNKKINIYIPVSIDEENVFKYDPNSNYYKDKCFPSLTGCGDSNILEERKNKFNNNYLSLCEANCTYKGYDTGTKKVICECSIKTNFINLSQILGNKNELLFKIIDEDKIPIQSSNFDFDSIISTMIEMIPSSVLDSYSILNDNSDIPSNTNINSDRETDINMNTREDSDTNYGVRGTEYSNPIILPTTILTNLQPDDIYTKYLKYLNSKDLFDDEGYFMENPDENLKQKIDNRIREELIRNSLDIALKENDYDLIIDLNNIKYQISTSFNQFNKKYDNISTIYLKECENTLKNQYNISFNDSLLIYKIDIIRDNYSLIQVIYEVYNIKTKQILNLTYCKNNIIISYPVSINEEKLYLYNPADYFYSDFCISYTKKNGTDITLKDRQNEYINKNLSLCDDNCKYYNYS